jgi:stage V sporulation protein G
MARRYGPDGQPLYNGKTPGEFTENDARQFIEETNKLLNGKDFENMPTATQTQTAAPARAPDSVNVIAKVWPIKNPQGNVLATAAVSIDGLVAIRNLQVISGANGLFIGLPRERGGDGQFKDIAYPILPGLRAKMNEAVMDEFIIQHEKTAPDKARISDQIEKAAQEAAKANAVRTTPEKAKPAPAHDGR